MARFSFYTTDGPDKGKTFELTSGTILVGRRDTAASDDPADSERWVLTDPAVSRTHARIDWDGQGPPVLIHLSSTNATLLNGKIVSEDPQAERPQLNSGDKIRMGQTGFEVKETAYATRWCLLERSEQPVEHELSGDDTIELDGVGFRCSPAGIEVALQAPEQEAYLLRKIDDQFWTTALKEQTPVVLRKDDIVQTESRKVVLLDREGE